MRRTRSLTVVGALALVGLLAGCAPTGADDGSRTAPPWPAPTALATRAADAGLENVWGRPLAEHIHAHVSITLDGEPVTIPGDIGHSAARHFAAQIHTHDTSGIVHVESPTRGSFTLGQFFDEWGVPLSAWHVGDLGTGGAHGASLAVWVDGHRRFGNPRRIELRNLEEVDLVVTRLGAVSRRSPAFDWPPQYHAHRDDR